MAEFKAVLLRSLGLNAPFAPLPLDLSSRDDSGAESDDGDAESMGPLAVEL